MKNTLLQLIRTLRSIPYRGSARRCDICGTTARRFRAYGTPPREDAQCWRCHSLERHRFMWHFIERGLRSDISAQPLVLHIAPEACFSAKLRDLLGNGYLTADLHAAGVDVVMDITDIQFDEDHFDSILCSHVLEHVQDDHRALAEFYRVLRPCGKALLAVPITASNTVEDPTIVSPEERLKAFGQADHVRCYGHDFIERVRAVGFTVSRISVEQELSDPARTLLGISDHAGDIFVAEKPAT